MTHFSQKTPFNLAEFLSQPGLPARKRPNAFKRSAAPVSDQEIASPAEAPEES